MNLIYRGVLQGRKLSFSIIAMINMSQMKKKLWSKFGLVSFTKKGRHGKEEDVNSLMGKSNVNEEYKEAFRTKSYIEMCNKFQGQLEIRTSIDQEKSPSSSLSSSSSSSSSPLFPSSPPTRNVHLSDYLLEARHETLIENSKLHQYLVNYFKISLEACQICESLLKSVYHTRVNYRSIKNVIKLIKQVPDNTNWTHNQYHTAYKNLASFALHRNPFSTMTPKKFHDLHYIHLHLLQELTTNYRITKRRTKFVKFIKRALSTLLVVGCGAIGITLLILTLHSMVGIVVAAPGLAFCSLGLFMMQKMKQPGEKLGKNWVKGLDEQLDIAARGVYILINDFDTISRVVQRLNDEMEHRKFMADICVRKGKNEMLKEVVKEFQMHEYCFVEQLEELEKQIYLCFLDINRSRRLVLQEMAKY